MALTDRDMLQLIESTATKAMVCGKCETYADQSFDGYYIMLTTRGEVRQARASVSYCISGLQLQDLEYVQKKLTNMVTMFNLLVST